MAEAMLLHVLDSQWPVGLQAMFLQTPGGFVSGPFPADWSGGVSWGSQHQDFADLLIPAQQVLARTVTERVLEAAKGKVRALTIGISLARAERPQRRACGLLRHSQSPSLLDWELFPAKHQERDLFQIIDLDTHLIEAEEERILVLGSYDLSVYNPRANPSGLRRLRCTQLRSDSANCSNDSAIIILLWTDTPRMWLPAWTELEKELPSVKTWASGICYHSLDKRPRGRLRDVLVRTTGGAPYDFIVVSSGNWAEAR